MLSLVLVSSTTIEKKNHFRHRYRHRSRKKTLLVSSNHFRRLLTENSPLTAVRTKHQQTYSSTRI